jgi:hypothetical protein
MAGQEPLLSFSFSDLVGDFTVAPAGQSGLFTASDDAVSTGDVTRVIGATPGDQTAVFANGVNFPGAAAFDLQLPVSGVTAVSALTVGGTLTLADIDGDSIVTDVTGAWERLGTFGALFVGLVNNVQINMGGDGVFEGADGEGFSMLGFPGSGLEGSVVAMAVPGWFLDDQTGEVAGFEGANVGSIGAIVPEPLTFTLLAIGGLATVVRRRQRRS